MISLSEMTRFGSAGAHRRDMLGPALFATAFAGAALLFFSGFVSLTDAWSIPEYSHGPIIPLISLFLFLREMRTVPPSEAPVTDRWPGVVVAAAGMAIGVFGGLVRIPDIITYGFIVWVAGVVLVCFGLRRGANFWPAVLHLVFMLPLPQFVYWQVSVFLQLISSEIGVGIIALMGIPVFLDGNIIDLGVYKLQVAEACSGLRYLFPMLSFSYVFAVLYNGPVWHKLVLVSLAAPITVMMNSFRIGMIGVLVNSYGIGHAEGFLHAFEGWIIFVACVCILFLCSILLQQLTAQPKRLSETLDIEFEGLGDQLRRYYAIPRSAALMTLAVLTVGVALAQVAAPSPTEVRPYREPLVVFPGSFDAWRGQQQELSREIEIVLGADDYASMRFTHPEERASIDLFIAYYNKQTEGSGIHSPEVCIPVGGWEVSGWRETTVTPDGVAPFAVNRAIIQKGVNRQLVYYWFEQRGRRMTSDYAVKMVTVWDALTEGRTDGGLVRLITPIGMNEDEAAADARLQTLLDEMITELPRFLPH